MKPLLFVTGHVPAYRAGALARLHEREDIEVAVFGGRSLHGGPAHDGALAFPLREVRPRDLFALAAAGAHRAVVCPTGGRLAPLATWAGTRRARVPLVLWASLWAHPRTPAHLFTYLPLRRLYRSADAVVTYGGHVADYVKARGARNVHVAPQSVDNDFWGALDVEPAGGAIRTPGWPSGAGMRFLFVSRPDPEKGLGVLLEAWERAGAGEDAALVLAGPDAAAAAAAGPVADRVVALGAQPPAELRRMYAASDVLVVPSLRRRNFLEPWGLVVNEAMNSATAVIASDAVGAAAGGLVRDGGNGLVVRAGDAGALAGAIARLAGDRALAERFGRAGAEDVRAYSHDAWAEGFSRALASLNLSRGRW